MQSINELVMNITEGARAAHAFACEGRAGEARRAFINDLAAGLLCTSPEAGARPCGRCPSCLQAAAGTSLDIVRMSRSTGASKTGRETYRVDDAAAFIERLSMGSYGRHRMRKQKAQKKRMRTLNCRPHQRTSRQCMQTESTHSMR